MFTNSWCTSV